MSTEQRFCKNCGNRLAADARFCGDCGEGVRAIQRPGQSVAVADGGAAGSERTQVLARPAASRRAELRLSAADGSVFEPTEPQIYIGRVASNTVPVDSPRVSRQHARITQSDGQIILEDLGSTNGTYLNGQPVMAPVPLRNGDTIMLGDEATWLRVAIRETQAPSPMPEVAPAPGTGPGLSAPIYRGETVVGGIPIPAIMGARPVVGEQIIGLTNVVKSFKSGESTITILKGINLEIGKGEFVALLGPSGCGKTTTLNMIIGIDRPDSGEVVVAGQPIHTFSENQMARWRGKHIGVVFQFFQLLPTLSVAENVMMPMHFTKTYKKGERRERALECLRLVNIEQMADRMPSALSGGQQQRVAIARALACDPPILVADEPTGNLDSKNSQNVFELLMQLNAAGKTIVMVTHDPVLARSIPRRIEMLDGEIVG